MSEILDKYKKKFQEGAELHGDLVYYNKVLCQNCDTIRQLVDGENGIVIQDTDIIIETCNEIAAAAILLRDTVLKLKKRGE